MCVSMGRHAPSPGHAARTDIGGRTADGAADVVASCAAAAAVAPRGAAGAACGGGVIGRPSGGSREGASRIVLRLEALPRDSKGRHVTRRAQEPSAVDESHGSLAWPSLHLSRGRHKAQAASAAAAVAAARRSAHAKADTSARTVPSRGAEQARGCLCPRGGIPLKPESTSSERSRGCPSLNSKRRLRR